MVFFSSRISPFTSTIFAQVARHGSGDLGNVPRPGGEVSKP
jgi:hypothetical protein